MATVALCGLTRPSVYFPSAHARGIGMYDLSEESGDLTLLGITEGIDNPAFSVFSRRHGVLYVVSEVIGWNEGTVSAYRYHPETRSLSYINKQVTLGSVTAHVTCDRDESFLAISNYSIDPEDSPRGQALAVLPIRPDGGIGPATDSRAHGGHGPHPTRQERSHVHCCKFSPDNRYLLCGEFGLDRVLVYPFDGRGRLGEIACAAGPAKPGNGPRHLAFHPHGRVVYAANELSGSVAAYSYEPESGQLALLADVVVVPEEFTTSASCSEVAVHPSGRFVLAADRGCNSIAVLELGDDGRTMRQIGLTPSGGVTPRHFAISPSGRWVLACNQNDDSVVVLQFDAATGQLTGSQKRVTAGSPMCATFIGP